MLQKLFKGGNYSRAKTIHRNTVIVLSYSKNYYVYKCRLWDPRICTYYFFLPVCINHYQNMKIRIQKSWHHIVYPLLKRWNKWSVILHNWLTIIRPCKCTLYIAIITKFIAQKSATTGNEYSIWQIQIWANHEIL